MCWPVLAAIAGISGLAITIIKPDGLTILFGLISLYGAMSYTLYSITVAHANDYAPSDKFVTVSGGLLLLYGWAPSSARFSPALRWPRNRIFFSSSPLSPISASPATPCSGPGSAPPFR
jgi:hypothetical protein